MELRDGCLGADIGWLDNGHVKEIAGYRLRIFGEIVARVLLVNAGMHVYSIVDKIFSLLLVFL
jgi:hypothetical protein